VTAKAVTSSLRSASRRARAGAASSRVRASPLIVTNLGPRAVLSPSTSARARFSWALGVLLSRVARLAGSAHTACHDDEWLLRVQTGSALSARALPVFLPARGEGVGDLPVRECVPAPPEVGLQVGRRLCGAGAGDEPEPDTPSSSRRLAADSMPASATTVMLSVPCRAVPGRESDMQCVLPASMVEQDPGGSARPRPRELRRVLAANTARIAAVSELLYAAPPGIAATSFASVSLDPPLVWVCIARDGDNLACPAECPRLESSVLAAHQKRAGWQLGNSGWRVLRLAGDRAGAYGFAVPAPG